MGLGLGGGSGLEGLYFLKWLMDVFFLKRINSCYAPIVSLILKMCVCLISKVMYPLYIYISYVSKVHPVSFPPL